MGEANKNNMSATEIEDKLTEDKAAKEMSLREQLIEATIQEFANKRLKFTMDDLAKKLGISKKTIYTEFSNKEELVKETVDFIFAEIKRSEKEILEDDSLDTVTKLKKVLIVMPDNRQDIDFREVSEMRDKYPELYKCIAAHLNTEWEPTMELYRKAVDEGKLKKVPEAVLKLMVTGAMQAMLTSGELEKNDIQYTDALEIMIEIIFSGLVIDGKS